MASFIALDRTILSDQFEVIENTYAWEKKIRIPFFLIRQLFFLLKHSKKAEHIVVSFGGYWSLLPSIIGKIYKKPVYIILHGTDCAAFKEINYGNIRKPILRTALKMSYKRASMLLPVSESLIYSENNYFFKDQTIKQGVQHFFPEITTKNRVISNAVDSEKWRILENFKRVEHRFITVLGNGQFLRKGGFLILETAKKLPQFEFIFIGANPPVEIKTIPDNVKFLGRMNATELLDFYNTSKFYLQLSNFEGFGVALCEAMLCGCIPIVANTNDMPNIVKDTGYILKKRDSELLCRLLLEAHAHHKDDLGIKARQNIVQNYSIGKRKSAIFDVLKQKSSTSSS